MDLTIVIPALNEAERLPALLTALASQTMPPAAVVVADAGSTDETASIARAAGARVVMGGLPGPGRNAGAAVATTDLVLFLDADTLPASDFLGRALAEFSERELDCATSLIEPIEREARNIFVCDVCNLYLRAIQFVSPHAPGFCIFVRTAAHRAIGGFDETVVMAEDHDYVQRVARIGTFGVLTSVRLATSMRRIEKEGLVRLAFKYLYTEILTLAGRPIHSVPFNYEFGRFASRESVLERLMRVEFTAETFERWLLELPWPDLNELEAYVRERLEALRNAVGDDSGTLGD